VTTPAASIPLAVQALLTCLKKCGAMDNANRERLRRRIERHGVLDLPGLRKFLETGGVQPVVAGTLIAMLPPEDDIVIGGCHLLAHLANGGMGTVWLAGYDGALVVLKPTSPRASTIPTWCAASAMAPTGALPICAWNSCRAGTWKP